MRAETDSIPAGWAGAANCHPVTVTSKHTIQTSQIKPYIEVISHLSAQILHVDSHPGFFRLVSSLYYFIRSGQCVSVVLIIQYL